jgi:hypothetical protein
MAEETVGLDERISAAWKSAGLDARNENTEVFAEGSDDVEDDGDDTPVDTEDADGDADVDPVDPDTDADASDTDADEKDGEAEVEVEAEPIKPSKTEEKAQKEAEDDLAEALGLGKPPADPKKRAQWWKTRLPYSQVHKAVTERTKKITEGHAATLKERDDKLAGYDTRFTDVQKVEKIITENPEQYVRTLAQLFPETYGQLFAPLFRQGDTKAEELVKPEDPGPMPEPDFDLGDGRKTYSMEGMTKLREWDRKVTQQETLKSLQPHIAFLDQQKTAAAKKQQEDQQRETIRKGQEVADAALAEIRTLDLAEENLDAILAEAQKCPAHYDAEKALNVAYRKVVMPKLKANRDEMQAQIVKDLKKASAKKTSATLKQQSVGAKKDETTESTGDAEEDLNNRIRRAWKRKGLSA